MSGKDRQGPEVKLDPGAFNAAMFEAYGSDCMCNVCQILRAAIKSTVDLYLPKGGEGGVKRGKS